MKELITRHDKARVNPGICEADAALVVYRFAVVLEEVEVLVEDFDKERHFLVGVHDRVGHFQRALQTLQDLVSVRRLCMPHKRERGNI